MRKLIQNNLIGRIICRSAYETPTRDGNWGWYWFYTVFYGLLAYIIFGAVLSTFFGIEVPAPGPEPSAWD